MATVAMTGANGFVGSALQKMFVGKGYHIVVIKRSDLHDVNKMREIVSQSDVVVNLAGANIIARWTKEYKKEIYNSRIDTTKALIQAIENAKIKPKVLISTSAVGIYSNRIEQTEENCEYGEDFLANVCRDWEKEANRANELGVRTVIFRFGIVMGKNGGAFAKMITPFKFGLGGNIGSGKQHFSFIHLEDLVNAYKFVVENETMMGVYNMVEPYPTINEGLTVALSRALNRPAFLDVSEFVLGLIFGDGAKVLTNGQRVLPKRLLDAGFEFRYGTIDKTINNLVGVEEYGDITSN